MKKIIASIVLVMIICNFAIVTKSLAYDIAEEEFSFSKDVYTFIGEGDSTRINMTLPYGYNMSDVEFYSENPDIADVVELELFDTFYILETYGIGETSIMATIPGTNYVAYCNVVVENPIKLSIEEDDVGVNLKIESVSDLYFSISTRQAVEIMVQPENSTGEAEWIRLGEDIFGGALNKEYNYHIEENCTVTVRQISWWVGEYYNGEINELVSNSIAINGMEPVVSIGAGVNIYQEDGIDTVEPSENVQLKVDLVELPLDENVTWKSYDEDIAYVDENGYVYTYREGQVKIEATVKIGNAVYTDIYTLEVKENNDFSTLQIFPKFETMFNWLVF